MISELYFKDSNNKKLYKARREYSNIKGLQNREQDGMNTLGRFYKEDKLYFCKKFFIANGQIVKGINGNELDKFSTNFFFMIFGGLGSAYTSEQASVLPNICPVSLRSKTTLDLDSPCPRHKK